jgi:hypothetical protein
MKIILKIKISQMIIHRLFLGVLFVLSLIDINGQYISLSKLLELQKSTPIYFQDYLESNSWKLKEIITLRQADSTVFNKEIIPKIKFGERIQLSDLEMPAWIGYESKTDIEINGQLYVPSIIMSFPNFNFFKAVNRTKRNPYARSFGYTIEYSYTGDSIQAKILKEILALKIPNDSTSIRYFDGWIIRIYKLKTQIIELTTYPKSSNVSIISPTSYSINIYSLNDYLYLN